MDVNEELKFLRKFKKKIKKNWGGGGGGSGRGRVRGVRVDVNEELKFLCNLGWWSGQGEVGFGGQGRCE